MCKHTVLAHYGHYVRCGTHGHQVQAGQKFAERNAVVKRICLHQLETHTASRKMFEWVGGVKTFSIQYGYCRRQFVIWNVVVTHNEVYAFLFGIGYLLDCLDAAIQHNDKLYARLIGVIHTLL